jgi:hypothetical protein
MEKGIDFIVSVYAKRHYLRMLVDSIHKYVKNTPYTINIVNCWYDDESAGLKELNEMFGEDDKVRIIRGFDQSDTTILQNDGAIFQDTNKKIFKGKIDGNSKSASTYYNIKSFCKGLDETNREYTCMVDLDLIFLNEWVDELLPLLEKYVFISNRWDPGQIFWDAANPIPEKGIAKFMFFFSKRSLYTELMEYPSFDYRDNGGNLTYHAQQNGLPFLVLNNTYWNSNRRKNYNVRITQNGLSAISYDHIKKWHVGGDNDEAKINREHHLIDMVYGEQMYINDIPFAFHQNRGIRNTTSKNDDWVSKASEYLENN